MRTDSKTGPLEHFPEILTPIMKIEDQGVGHPPKLRRIKERFRFFSIALFDFNGDLSRGFMEPRMHIVDDLEFLRCRIAGFWRQLFQPFAKGTFVVAGNLIRALFKLPPLNAVQKRTLPRRMGTNRISDVRVACDFTGAHLVCFPKPSHVASKRWHDPFNIR